MAQLTVTRSGLSYGRDSSEGMLQESTSETSATDKATNRDEVYNAEVTAAEYYSRMGSIFRSEDDADAWVSRSEYRGCSRKDELVNRQPSTIPVQAPMTGQPEMETGWTEKDELVQAAVVESIQTHVAETIPPMLQPMGLKMSPKYYIDNLEMHKLRLGPVLQRLLGTTRRSDNLPSDVASIFGVEFSVNRDKSLQHQVEVHYTKGTPSRMLPLNQYECVSVFRGGREMSGSSSGSSMHGYARVAQRKRTRTVIN